MRHLSLIFLLITLTAIKSTGQQKGDNAIIIHDNITIQQISDVLFDAGYEINHSDSIYLTTAPKGSPTFSIKISVRKRDATYIIKATAKPLVYVNITNNPINYDYYPIEYGGTKGSMRRDTWNELDAIAKKLGSKLEYVKQ